MAFVVNPDGTPPAFITAASVESLSSPIGPQGRASLSLTLVQNLNGNAEYKIFATDDGGTGSNGVDQSDTLTFTVSVRPVNNQPSFVSVYMGASPEPLEIHEDSVLAPGAVRVEFATQISVGPANEASQSFTFILTFISGNANLFESMPTIGVDGYISVVLKPYMNGVASYSVSCLSFGFCALARVRNSLLWVSFQTI